MAANNVATIVLQDGTSTTSFGTGAVSLGDVLPGGGTGSYGDLAVMQLAGAAAGQPSQVLVVPGRAYSGAIQVSITAAGGVTAEDAKIVRLQPEPSLGGTGFGSPMLGGKDLDGGGVADLVLVHLNALANKRLYVFKGEDLAAAAGGALKVTVADLNATNWDGVLVGTHGFILSGDYYSPALIGNFDDEAGAVATEDLAHGKWASSGTVFGSVWIRSNIEDLLEGAFDRGMFPYLTIQQGSPYVPDSTKFGSAVAGLGDFNGDGFPDIAVGNDGTGYLVLVY
jgi:hypothetical protein